MQPHCLAAYATSPLFLCSVCVVCLFGWLDGCVFLCVFCVFGGFVVVGCLVVCVCVYFCVFLGVFLYSEGHRRQNFRRHTA